MRAVSPVLTALFVCSSLSGFAQQGASSSPLPPPPESATSSTGDSGRRITLDVVVTDKSGNPVPGLQQQDFTVLDDEQPQKILSFSATDETGKRLVLRSRSFCWSMQSTTRLTAWATMRAASERSITKASSKV
jgi:hypothetical protein